MPWGGSAPAVSEGAAGCRRLVGCSGQPRPGPVDHSSLRSRKALLARGGSAQPADSHPRGPPRRAESLGSFLSAAQAGAGPACQLRTQAQLPE